MIWFGLSEERWRELEMGGDDVRLTPEEIAAGWHFCDCWDGMLVNYNDTDGEGSACTCRNVPSEVRE